MLFGEVMEPLRHGALLEEEPHGSQTRRVQNLALLPPASGVPMSCDLSAFCSCHLLPCLPCGHGLSLWPVNPNKLPFVSGPGHGALAQQQGQVIHVSDWRSLSDKTQGEVCLCEVTHPETSPYASSLEIQLPTQPPYHLPRTQPPS